MLRDVFLGHLQRTAGHQLDPVSSFLAEYIHADLGRPDLEGQHAEGRPVVVVEAKFGAKLSPSQVGSYLIDQQGRLARRGRGILVVLVPAHRQHEAENLVPAVHAYAAGKLEPGGGVDLHVEAWDELLDVLDAAAEKTEGDQRTALTSDLLQLRDLLGSSR
ncbi:MAG: hypothetical protein ACR2JO_00010 [Mycobacteriales bacterium]